MKTMKLFLVLLVMVFTSTFVGCDNPNKQYQNQQPVQVQVTEAEPNVGDNLNLPAVGELIKTCKTPEEIEMKLNEPGNLINNLDLNGDGVADMLTVVETEKGKYTIIDNQSDGKTDVAYLNVIVQPDNTVNVNINGNPQYYGNNCNYQSSFSAGDMMLMYWLTRPHYSLYASPYYYGHYYHGYSPYRVVPYRTYHSNPYISSNRTKTTYKTTTITTTKTFNNTSNVVKNHANISHPTQSQKSFQNRDNSKPIGSGGFNNKNTNSSNKTNYQSTGYGSGAGSNSNYKQNKPVDNHANISNPNQSQQGFKTRDNSKSVGSGGFNNPKNSQSMKKLDNSIKKNVNSGNGSGWGSKSSSSKGYGSGSSNRGYSGSKSSSSSSSSKKR